MKWPSPWWLVAAPFVVIAASLVGRATLGDRARVGVAPNLESVGGGYTFALEGEAAHLDQAIGVFTPTTTLPARTLASLAPRPSSVLTVDEVTLIDDTLTILQQDLQGRVLAQSFDPPKTEAEMVAWLRTLEPGLLGLIGYVGNDGDVYALTQLALEQQASQALLRELRELNANAADPWRNGWPWGTDPDTSAEPLAKPAPLFTVGDKILAALTCMPAVNACYYDLFDVLEVRPDGWLKVVSPNGAEWMVNSALVYAFQKNPEGVIIAEVPQGLDVTAGGN